MSNRLLSSLALGAVAACSAADAAPDPITPAKVDAAVNAGRDMTFDLAKRIEPNNNAVFSPASIHMALGMTHAGAKGQTQTDMGKALHFDKVTGDAPSQLGFLLDALRKLEHPDQSFHMVNRLFGDKRNVWKKSFVELTATRYGAPLESIDFTKSEDARSHINKWVAGETHDKITELLPPASIDASTRLVLTNAVYFKGAWASKFEASSTTDQPFSVRGTTATKTKMMRQMGHFMTASDGDMDILEMPYKYGDVAMDIVLPKKANGLAAVEAKLGMAKLDAMFKSLKSEGVDVSIPKFKIRTAVGMRKILEKMGMASAFLPTADFSPMVETKTEPLFISQVFHQGFIEIDEAGTEAAAATAVVMTDGGAAPPAKAVTFRADHPFVYLIRDVSTGEILFYGRVVDPTAR